MRRTLTLLALALALVVLIAVAGCGGHKKTKAASTVEKAQRVYTRGNWSRIETNLSMQFPDYDSGVSSKRATKSIVDGIDRFEKAHPNLEIVGSQIIVFGTPSTATISGIIIYHKPQSGPCGTKAEAK